MAHSLYYQIEAIGKGKEENGRHCSSLGTRLFNVSDIPFSSPWSSAALVLIVSAVLCGCGTPAGERPKEAKSGSDQSAKAPSTAISSKWHPCAPGLEVRVSSPKMAWEPTESPAFSISVRNTSSRAIGLMYLTHAIIFVDDLPYVDEIIPMESIQPSLEPGKTEDFGSVTLRTDGQPPRLIRVRNIQEPIEMNAKNLGEALVLNPGEHRIRISCSPIETEALTFVVGAPKPRP